MEMTFEQFETIPKRTLSPAQERRLHRKHCCGDFGKGSNTTIKSLVTMGYIESDGKAYKLTEKAAHYIFHHGTAMPV